MTIQVVCECGFRKAVPDNWQGMRVKCKCGRSFVICEEGGLQEPPVAAPPPQAEASPVEGAEPPEVAAPPDVAAPPAAAPAKKRSSESVAARFRARHHPADSRKRLIFGGGLALSLICLGALAFSLRDQFTGSDNSEIAKSTTTEKGTSDTDGSGKADAAKSSNADEANTKGDEPGDTSELAQEMEQLDLRMAEIELRADDALVLTGLFGDVQIELTEDQVPQVEKLAGQLEAKAGELVAGELKLEQWYLDGEKIGSDLLELLTAEQRGRLRDLIQRRKITRVRLESYAATLRPELETPSVSWKIDPDSAPLPAVRQCDVSGSLSGKCILTAWPSGALALTRNQADGVTYELWDLIKNTIIGNCTVPTPKPDDATVVAQGGRLIVRGGKNSDGDYQIQVWSVDSGSANKSKTLPTDDPTSYQLVDCVANRVLCVSASGYWVWNLDSDDTRQVSFPDWVPHDMPKCAISPGGRYLAVTHRHSPLVESRQYHFLEVGIYELDTGDLLGNQVIATDYRPLQVAAIAFSYNGRELALLWDVEPPEPKRLLLQLSAISGKVLRVAGELPTRKEGYAHQHDMLRRDLMWLPDESGGWIVNLQSLVDTELDGAIDLELPTSSSGDGSEPRIKNIVDAIPAGNHRLLIITAEPAPDDPATRQVQGQFVELPKTGPFM